MSPGTWYNENECTERGTVVEQLLPPAQLGAGKRAFIRTFGCQMNEHDSEIIRGELSLLGYELIEDPQQADLILFNTCAVRENPTRKLLGQVADLSALKRSRPNLVIGICGCLVQQQTELERILHQLPHVDLIFGTHNIHRLPVLLQTVLESGRQVVEVWDEDQGIVEGLPVQRVDDLKAYVTIQHGCDKYCSFCIVPYTRGRERSRRAGDILAEIEQLGQQGFKEVTLLGQNVNSWGKDLTPPLDFADLLWKVNDIPGIERIRFTSPHPRDITDALIACLRDAPKVMESLHLPLQSGSDRILYRMNRRYTQAHYLRLVDKVRAAIPQIGLTTDIIVGFPGETDEDFEQTLDVVRKVQYDGAFTFIYSPRPGTPAARRQDQVPDNVKKERIYRLIQLQNEISHQRMQQMVGKTVEVLVEGRSEKDPTKLAGRTRTNKWVIFEGPLSLRGQLVPVKITRAQTFNLFGTLTGPEPCRQAPSGSTTSSSRSSGGRAAAPAASAIA
ncbi:MAG: tRNA (N6-isopentenyl adenosine(37)-C2)-methylthiotransferase MiaB [Limnochordaceae bacterium]|nr:tRNA (N6-isopentenyl adenosine(37)-C2)-methylthiotransferase MiaB [Limnochordaceae bacterium]